MYSLNPESFHSIGFISIIRSFQLDWFEFVRCNFSSDSYDEYFSLSYLLFANMYNVCPINSNHSSILSIYLSTHFSNKKYWWWFIDLVATEKNNKIPRIMTNLMTFDFGNMLYVSKKKFNRKLVLLATFGCDYSLNNHNEWRNDVPFWRIFYPSFKI